MLQGGIGPELGVAPVLLEWRGRVGEDMGGDYIIPGLVELHTDHLEGHYAPRPKVRWNPIAAVVSYDGQLAISGITTVLDSLRVGRDDEVRDGGLAAAINAAREARVRRRISVSSDVWISSVCVLCP